ncbi:Asp-tRNA(Asn)/Glu-tRNA(Gln) amidotransferase subunit GatA [Cellvibrio polysaccharolyticus]|uniref:Glutamyl-tRNA(Gln) amidotransferase subunit A n=1 Tax=Cellvibrio polysaccharolyticus TaxID=2082724 RepID=A0A928V209_9GAMM|nr:Asp-tRNA(Asn)/Glu-tRNA(Gln) amidotransferase subunit GatA [Cellvibrio polysaccharolyticus]MBE8716827.1 Asp-tRNA(Asn)/Glu-tRNA(Gln) amidotransferase subunit GatA [Cellvibrio polysaccharolyticus]
MHQLTIAELVKGLRNKDFSSTELTRHYLDRIARLDPVYNSFITPTPELALQQAAEADRRLAAGNAPLLCGVPIAHKDIFCTDGIRTSCASKMLDNFIAPYNATIVENYLADGVITLGKTNMDEFAMGSSNETSFYGPVKNPWATDCVPGGSSGGSAAAVAAHLAPAATASDTGGSIRQPAALCGLTGIKPTYGRVSRWGMIAFASSLDQAGLLTRTAEDAALLLNTMASYDAKDSTCIERDVPDYTATLNNSLKGLKIGVPREYFGEGLNADTAARVQDAIKVYESLGASIHEVSLPHTHLAVPAYYVIAPAECSANLSRFDGVRYGYRCENPTDLADLYKRSRTEAFGDEVKRRILVGSYALSAGYYDAYYSKAQKVRRLIRQDFVDAFKQVDVILGPTSPSPAFAFGSKTKDPVAMYLEDIYTIATNLAGLPGLSIPCGLVDNKPVGLQLIGNDFAEGLLLNAAHQFQQATNFHQLTAPGIE